MVDHGQGETRPALRWNGCAAPMLALALAVFAEPALARDSLGVFANWAVFRDPQIPRCYAIAMAEPSTLHRDYQPYADVAWWPRQAIRGQVHFRLSRKLQPGAPIMLVLGDRKIALVGGGGNAWAADGRADAAIVTAMRAGRQLTISTRDAAGQGFSNTWLLRGAATAMDAAAIGCSPQS